MAKWNCWSGCLKWLLTSDSKAKSRKFKEPKKPRKWGCSMNRGFKLRQYPTDTSPNRTLSEAIEEQRKQALNVAMATAAAAEAAVAAAHAAAQVVRLTAGVSRSFHYLSQEDGNLAAIKIQSAYRGHLARRALSSLKGIVRLQAIVRGQTVRSQVSDTLKHLPSNARNQVDMQDRGKYAADEAKESPKLKHKFEEKETKERKASHNVEQMAPNKDFGTESCRTLGQWLDEEAEKSGKKEKSQQHLQSQVLLRRKSFSHHRKEVSSVGQKNSMPNSPGFPSYMAVTESARAKVRSMSTPRQRTEFLGYMLQSG